MDRNSIYAEVDKERERQDSIHPVLPKYFLHPVTDPTRAQFKVSEQFQKEDNDKAEANGEHSWYGIMNEEDAEVFSAETIEELETEVIQSIALRVRFYEQIKLGLIDLPHK